MNENFENYWNENVPQEAPLDNPIIKQAWQHGLVGHIAVNRYMREMTYSFVIQELEDGKES